MPAALLPLTAERLSELLLLLHGVAARPQNLEQVQRMCAR
jgi:hypothetical protein